MISDVPRASRRAESSRCRIEDGARLPLRLGDEPEDEAAVEGDPNRPIYAGTRRGEGEGVGAGRIAARLAYAEDRRFCRDSSTFSDIRLAHGLAKRQEGGGVRQRRGQLQLPHR